MTTLYEPVFPDMHQSEKGPQRTTSEDFRKNTLACTNKMSYFYISKLFKISIFVILKVGYCYWYVSYSL